MSNDTGIIGNNVYSYDAKHKDGLQSPTVPIEPSYVRQFSLVTTESTDKEQDRAINQVSEEKTYKILYDKNSKVSAIREILFESIGHLDNAIRSYSNDIDLQYELTLFSTNLFKLTEFFEISADFRDNLMVFMCVIQTDFCDVLEKQQLIRMYECVSKFRRNPFYRDEERSKIIDELESVGFSII